MKRIYYIIKLQNVSPIHIGNGDKEHTDLDVITDKEGHFYIPGSSIAGCMLHYLDQSQQLIFNPVEKGMNKQSPIFISDAVMTTKTVIETRDGIQLDENKITIDGSKYDFEVIPSNRKFTLRIEVTDRDNKNYEEIVEELLSAIQNQSIRFGFKTSRGLGCFEIIEAGKKVFDKENIQEFFNFDMFDMKAYQSLTIAKVDNANYTTVEATMKQNGGISIRAYRAEKGEADFEHIKSLNNPIIPGTSWNGLLRRSFENYAKELSCDINIKEIFGYIEGKKSKKSTIIISECTIEGGIEKETVRNKINPFHGGTVKGALFKEKTWYNGTTLLTLHIRKDKNEDMIINLLKLFFNDLHNGFIALGGQTSIGRGMFEVKEVKVNGETVNWVKGV